MHIELWGFLIALAILYWQYKSDPLPMTKWFFPNVSLVEAKVSHAHPWPIVSRVLGYVIFSLLILALINPVLPVSWISWQVQKPLPAQGRAAMLLVDVSGSMAEPYGSGPKSKMTIAKETVTKLIQALSKNEQNRQNLFGLSSFARACFVDCPLTYDTSFLKNRLDQLTPASVDAMNGTSLGYALFKSLQQILATQSFAKEAPIFSIPANSYAVIIITDGIEDPNPLDREDQFRAMPLRDALKTAERAGIRVYFISIEQNAARSFDKELDTIASWVEKTNGRLFKARQNLPLDQIIQSIQEMEIAKLPPVSNPQSDLVSIRWLFAWCSAVLLCIKQMGDLLVSRGCL